MAYITPIQYPVYTWPMRQILSISNSNPAIIVTTFDGINPGANDYISGLIARLYVPFYCVMTQANQLVGEITIIDPDTFSIDIDSTLFDVFVPFVPPTLPLQPGAEYQPPQVVIIGENSAMLRGAVKNILRPMAGY